MSKIQLNSLTFTEMEGFFQSIGEKKFRAGQAFNFIHKNHASRIEDITVFSKQLRDKLEDISYITRTEVLERYDSQLDDTKKYLFLLEDRNIIESVFMEYPHGITACISTQVGCRMGCSFCASTKEGLVRNLSPGEMLDQIYKMEEDQDSTISNIVLMGSGEPLDNYENLMKFLEIIHDEGGKNLSYRNITLSTCGLVPKMYHLADEGIPVNLSVSLHSPFDSIRQDMMPIGKRYPVDDIIKACHYYFDKTNRRITIEYTIIEGVNDREEDLRELRNLLRNLNCFINLIPLNPIKEYNKKRPTDINIEKFQKGLREMGINSTIRKEMGSDINASCGQLRRGYTNGDKGNIIQ